MPCCSCQAVSDACWLSLTMADEAWPRLARNEIGDELGHKSRFQCQDRDLMNGSESILQT